MKRKATLLIAALFLMDFGGVAYPIDDLMRDATIPDIFEIEPMVKEMGEIKEPSGGVLLSGDCSDFIDLSGMSLPIEIEGNTVGATNDYGPYPERPACWCGPWDANSCAGLDEVYKWTAPYDGEYLVSITYSNYDNCLTIYRFTCPDEPVYPDDFLCGADSISFGKAKIKNISMTSGEEILIVVDGHGNNAGWYMLEIFELPGGDIDSYIESLMRNYTFASISAGTIKDGQLDWTGSYGYANIEDSIPATDTTLYMLASISKTISSIAIMQLWEDSLFQLDDDINNYLPFNVRTPSYPSTPLTYRMLMSHVSGINDWWATLLSLINYGWDSPIPLGQFLEDYLTPGGAYYIANANFNSWEPGTREDYSSVGGALAAYSVEYINPDSISFDQYCDSNIFYPLGMVNSGCLMANIDTSNLAIPYDYDFNSHSFVPYGHYGDPYYPASCIRSSVQELSKFLMMFMQHGQYNSVRILDSATVELMTTVHYDSIAPTRGLLWHWINSGYRKVWGHAGGYYGVLTFMYYYPEENTGVVILTNGAYNSGVYYACNVLMEDLFDYAAGSPGFIAGTITNQGSNIIDHVFVTDADHARWDFSNSNGNYYLGGFIAGEYDITFSHPAYVETTIANISITLGDTTFLDVTLRSICGYVTGDVNGSDSYNGLDITYGVNFFKGGPAPTYECECPPYGIWYVAGDVNGSCSYNGLDITYGVNYFKGGADPIPCPNCPPVE